MSLWLRFGAGRFPASLPLSGRAFLPSLLAGFGCWIGLLSAEPSWKLKRVDESRREAAVRICDFVVKHTRDGRYHPPEALWAESAAYRAELAATLAMAGKLLEKPRYVEVAGSMFQQLLTERVDGVLWSVGRWCAFPVYRGVPLDWKEQNARPAPHYTNGLVTYSMGIYHQISGDPRVVEASRETLRKMFATWNYDRDKETMHHLTPESAALAAAVWEESMPEFAGRKEPLVRWVWETFPEKAPRDFPFFTLIRTMLLVALTGSEHLETAIRPAIDALLANPSWRFEHDSRDFRHNRATEDHVDVRATGALAATMRLFDLVAGKTVYTGTPLYRYSSNWLDEMRRPDGGVYGCRHIASARRYGLGSPPHYIQLWWILGGFIP